MMHKALATISAFLAVVTLACWATCSGMTGVTFTATPERFAFFGSAPTAVSEETQEAFRRDGPRRFEAIHFGGTVVTFWTHATAFPGRPEDRHWHRSMGLAVSPLTLLAAFMLLPALAASSKRFRPRQTVGKMVLGISILISLSTAGIWLSTMDESSFGIYTSGLRKSGTTMAIVRSWPTEPSQDVLDAVPSSTSDIFAESKFDVGVCSIAYHVRAKSWSREPDPRLPALVVTADDWEKRIHLETSHWLLAGLLATYPAIAFIRGPLRRWRRKKRGQCLNCGYDLMGNKSGVCPECGTEVTST